MKFRLRTLLIGFTLVSILIGWYVLRWQQQQAREKAIVRQLSILDELKSVAQDFEPKIREAILADPDFVNLFSESPIPLANHISGGSGGTSDLMNAPPNRSRSSDLTYHYYWPDKAGNPSKENHVFVNIHWQFDEQSKLEPVLRLDFSDTTLTQSVVKMMESELAKFEIEIVKKVVTP